MFVYKIVRKIDGRYFSLYGDCFPRLNLEYKIGEIVKPEYGKIFAYSYVDEWAEFKIKRTVLLCETYRPYTGIVKLFSLEHVEEAVVHDVEHEQICIHDACLCDWVKPIKELSREELIALFEMHNLEYMATKAGKYS